MYRERQWPRYGPKELGRIYAKPHCHTKWEDHIYRVEQTIRVAKEFGLGGLVADLSCGDATIARALSAQPILGDFAPGYDICGPIEQTIDQIPQVDTFILSETLEHVDDPELVLRKIRAKSRRLLLSTPQLTELDGNPEHYWCFDDEAVETMLMGEGWSTVDFRLVDCGYGYTYQLWVCE